MNGNIWWQFVYVWRLCVSGLNELLKIVSQECSRLQAEFQKNFGAHAAGANGVTGGATLLNNHFNQSAACMLPTDQSGQNVNGQNRVAGLFLDPSTAAFQPAFRDPSSSATNSGPDGLQCPPGSGPMNTQQYR